MQPSYYLKVYPKENRSDRVILYSTKRGSIALVEQETWQRLKNGELSPDEADLLKDLGMAVEDRETEKEEVLSSLDRLNADNPELHITVVLNMDCNFACTYCYEGDMKGNLYMSEKTKQGMIRLIRDIIEREKKTSLLVDFFGGEPLLSMPLLREIAGELNTIDQVSKRLTLVTNGSLLKKGIVEELLPLGLELVKVTIDGPAEEHNRTRPFKNGKGSFDSIIKNLKDVCDMVNIHIGGNFTEKSYTSFPSLMDYLIKEGLTPDRSIAIKFDPVLGASKDTIAPPRPHGTCATISDPWVIKATTMLRKEILKRGYRTQKITPLLCAVENKSAFTVNFDGLIYKCPAFLGMKGFEVGDVKRGIGDYAEAYNLDLWKNDTCMACEYLPLCFGGCRYVRFIRYGNLDAPDCKKAYLDTALETTIKQDIRYRS
ncbi:MAG: geopeptide radical SAM maturase [Deltaproteobacteria bacterium]|nr:geopeptide radical SAM maturase [Deltaproteobacteria bacterium]